MNQLHIHISTFFILFPYKSLLLLLLSHFSRVRLCVTPQTAAHQAPRPWDSPGKNTGVGCHFLLQCRKVKRESEVDQSCSTLSDPMDCSPPGSSIHGIFQVRAPEWGAIAFSTTEYQIESLLSILFSVYISVPIYPISLAPITISLFSMTVMEERMTQRSGSLHS